jgi:site-specific recombinase XerD
MDDFAVKGVIISRKSPAISLDERSEELTGKYADWLKSKGYASTTIRARVSVVCGFMRYLTRIQRVPEDITDNDIVHYLNARNDYSSSSISGALYSLKHFARFLFDTDVLKTDIVPLFPQGHKHRLASIVSVWKPGHVEKILAAVDRGSPIGRRDYAIIMIAARLGLRQTDISGLRLDCVNWENSRIETTQSKTGEPISLPLPDDVGWAIIDYLKHGRPKVDSPYIFVCHSKNAWGKRMSGFDGMLAKYIRQARLRLSDGQKHGMHSLRHTLASRLLEAKVPLTVISEILGQIAPDGIEKYLKVDVEMLRQCALNPQEVFENVV